MSATVETGVGEAADFVATVEEELTAALGFRPYPGTLNVERLAIEDLPERTLTAGGLSNEHCEGVVVRPCNVSGVRAAVLRPLVEGYPESKVELLAPVQLRSVFDLEDGDTIPVSPADEAWHPDGAAADPTALDEFDAVVFDLDGTLVDLAVDWNAAASDAIDLFERHGHDAQGANLWDLLERADDDGLRPELEAVLADHETAGAAASTRLRHADHLPLPVPTGVCSLNCEAACRRALDRHELTSHVDSVVGRDSVATYKPDPEPLLATLRALGADPKRSLFVGDSDRDEVTADRAGVQFRWV